MLQTPCAIYTRQSADTRQDLTSCDVQFAACREFVESHRWLGWELVEERFDDVGYSGATADRPALRRLLDRAREGSIRYLLIHRLDRLSRSLLDFVSMAQLLREHGVGLVIVTAPELGTNALGSLTLNLLASCAEFEREIIRERIGESREALKRRGRRIAGPVPFGYKTDRFTKQLVLDSVEAPQVRRLFEMAAAGMTPVEIAATIGEEGWRTKIREGRRDRGATGGNPWTARQVLATLSNPTYLGKFRDAGSGARPGVHEAIVTEGLFADVRAKIAARQTRTPGRVRDRSWLLQGLLRCAQCGRRMSTHANVQGSATYRYYRCRSHAGGRPPCRELVSAHEIESLILRILENPSSNGEIVAGAPSAPEPKRLEGLGIVLTLLESSVRHQLIRELVKDIRWSGRDGILEVTFDENALKRRANVNQDDLAPKVRES